jgi:hypothetical protein
MTVPSNCTLGYIKSYWEKAELPKEGTICEGDVKPLVDPPTDDLVEVEVEEEDVEVPTRAKRGLERGNEIVY